MIRAKKLKTPGRMERMDSFDTGATRSNDDEKLDYEGILSPLTLREYVSYCNKHRTQADGKKRSSDNWQLGIPVSRYMKSLWRHFMDVWTAHRGWDKKIDIKESLCATIFNASGMLHEIIKAEIVDVDERE